VKPYCWMRLPPFKIAWRCVPIPTNAEKNARGEEHMLPRHINPVQWQQAMDYARQACARIFRDGGSPSDAVRAFGLVMGEPTTEWSTAVDRIAHALCAPALRKAA
jgi:hypothetical protein